jgi:UDP-3-O-[3-hydroxymyristoyl] glucosamine N-acyltransferase
MLRGDHVFATDDRFDGMIGGNAIIAPDVTVDLSGMVGGDLIVGARATVRLNAMVAGNVVNHGGTIVTAR